MIGAFEIDVLVEAPGWDIALGGDAEAFAQKILGHAAKAEKLKGAVSVLLTHDAAMQSLNKAFRGQDKPTNVLSFPAAAPAHGLIGDLAIGLETVTAEARASAKPIAAHTAHMLVHGLLHLLGHDHVEDAAAQAMEARERALLGELGYADPYAIAAPGDGHP